MIFGVLAYGLKDRSVHKLLSLSIFGKTKSLFVKLSAVQLFFPHPLSSSSLPSFLHHLVFQALPCSLCVCVCFSPCSLVRLTGVYVYVCVEFRPDAIKCWDSVNGVSARLYSIPEPGGRGGRGASQPTTEQPRCGKCLPALSQSGRRFLYLLSLFQMNKHTNVCVSSHLLSLNHKEFFWFAKTSCFTFYSTWLFLHLSLGFMSKTMKFPIKKYFHYLFYLFKCSFQILRFCSIWE